MNFELLDRVNLIDALSHSGLKMQPKFYEIVNTFLMVGNNPTVIASELNEQEVVEKLIEQCKKHLPLSPGDSFRETAHRYGFKVNLISHQVTDKEGKVQAFGTEQQIQEWAVESGIYDRYIEHLASSKT